MAVAAIRDFTIHAAFAASLALCSGIVMAGEKASLSEGVSEGGQQVVEGGEKAGKEIGQGAARGGAEIEEGFDKADRAWDRRKHGDAGDKVKGAAEATGEAVAGTAKGAGEVAVGVGKGAYEAGKGVVKGAGCVVTLGNSC